MVQRITAKEQAKISLQATVMAVRELVMDYYKGTCVERVTTTNVGFSRLTANTTYRYQRREQEIAAAHRLHIGDVPILEVRKSPDKLVFYDKILLRSPEFTEVKKLITQFMHKYLKGVTVESDTKTVSGRYEKDASADGGLLAFNMPKRQQPKRETTQPWEATWESVRTAVWSIQQQSTVAAANGFDTAYRTVWDEAFARNEPVLNEDISDLLS